MPQSRLSGFFGPYLLLATMVVIGLLLLSLSRLGLMLWQYERVSEAGSLVSFMLQGVRADLIMMGLFLLPPLLLAPFWARSTYQRSWGIFCTGWALLVLSVAIFIEVSSPSFIQQFDLRPNRLYVEYLKYPKEVAATLWQGFRVQVILGVVFTLSFLLFLTWLLRKVARDQRSWPDTRLWITWPLILASVFMCIRSTTDHRPANPAFFAVTGDALVNSLIISSSYSVAHAIYSLKHEANSSEIYGKLSNQRVVRLALKWPWLQGYKFDNPELPTLHYQQAVVARDRPLNLVIILQESMGASFVESLGGVPATPNLELLKEQGWWFENLYSTGTRSVRGIEAVIAGFMPTPAQSVVKLSLAQDHFFTLGSLLANQGYHTQFVYGGEAHFDNMRSFFTGNGFAEVVDLQDIENPEFVGSWGASDEDLFNTAHQHIQRLHAAHKPFFSLIFTSSNHSPFEFPDGHVELLDTEKQSANNAVKYADYAMEKFIARAQSSDYWKDTVFLIVADHDSRVYGAQLVPINKFQIPGLILGADIAPKRILPVASQIDLAPTLLSLMGLSATHPMIGRDFAWDSTSPGRALMQFDQYFALMREEDVVVLKPNGEAVKGRYEKGDKGLVIESGTPPSAEVEFTLAQVLLPSILYREQKYHQAEPQD